MRNTHLLYKDFMQNSSELQGTADEGWIDMYDINCFMHNMVM